jgi:tRNA (guanine-N7-)-methyltransferase
VDEFVRVLRPGGVLHLATDWLEYADVMRTVCKRPELDATALPARATTKYESKGVFEGRTMTDLAYARITVTP